MLTSESKRTIVAGAMQLGIDDYMLKPFKPDFRLVLVDMVIPDVNSVALMNQLRALQPHAAFVALVLRGGADPKAEITDAGFSDFLHKPFEPDAILELLGRFFDEKLAAACYDECILDLRALPLRGDRTIRMLMDIAKDAGKLGMTLRLVGTGEAKALLGRVTDTADMPFFDSPKAARSMAA